MGLSSDAHNTLNSNIAALKIAFNEEICETVRAYMSDVLEMYRSIDYLSTKMIDDKMLAGLNKRFILFQYENSLALADDIGGSIEEIVDIGFIGFNITVLGQLMLGQLEDIEFTDIDINKLIKTIDNFTY